MSTDVSKRGSRGIRSISPEMTVLDVVSRFRETEGVFKKYDTAVGECICCQTLFDPLRNVAARYGLDLEKLLEDLESVVNERTENTLKREMER
jgi:hypothetical protein